MKTLEEVHPPLDAATTKLTRQSARAASLRANIIARNERVRLNQAVLGNKEENNRRAILGDELLPEVLSDREQEEKDRSELANLDRALPSTAGEVQRQRDIASAKLCAQVSPEYTALVKDFARDFAACHGALTRIYDFTDKIESMRASTTALNPISPNGLHPRETSGIFHWTFREMRENGHISMRDIPEAVR
jgi:hypothetical protein